jgi:peptidoglycan/xylan/chitin deacetylase (PgdA/CDA1 family)
MIDRRTALLTLLLSAAAAPRSARSATFRGGVVSLTYDDGLDSHLDIALPALDARGLHGTFYVTLENIAQRAGEWRQLAAKGNELANHTVSHPCDIGGHRWRSYGRSEIAPVNRTLDSWSGAQERHDFAYPCDVTNLGPGSPNRQLNRFEAVLQSQHIASARTSEGLPNSPGWVRRHPYRLQALAAGFDATTLPELAGYVARAQRENRWAILIFHEIVRSRPGNGEILAGIHDDLLDAILAMNIECRRVCDVVKDVEA